MEVGGYYQQIFGYTDADKHPGGGTDDVGDFGNYQNAEVYFRMRGELDNGLLVGGRIELEGEDSGDQIDQAYLVLAGGFGELRLGAINSGRYSYGWNTDGPNVGMPINSGWVSSWVPAQNNTGFRFRSPGISTVIDASNDEQKVTYFTPRFNGFQFTASWTPRAHVSTSNSVGQGGESFAPTGPADEDFQYVNALDFGVSYSGEFQGVGVELQGGVFTADVPEVADGVGFDDYFGYNGGIALSFGGLSVAGSAAVVEDGMAFGCAGTTTVSTFGTATGIIGGGGATFVTVTTTVAAPTCASSNEGESYNAGIAYSTGPWGFSFTYFNGQEEGLLANPGDEENEFFTVAASYTIGPGIRTWLTYLHAELDDDLPGGAGDNEGDAVILGVALGF